jgi:dipeptidyl aminopeptidase/acylaminoacyl peptidase
MWPEKINVPLLLLHGGADEGLDPLQTIRFAEKLQQLKKSYELLIYAGDNHTLRKNQLDRDARVAAWFTKHIKK